MKIVKRLILLFPFNIVYLFLKKCVHLACFLLSGYFWVIGFDETSNFITVIQKADYENHSNLFMQGRLPITLPNYSLTWTRSSMSKH